VVGQPPDDVIAGVAVAPVSSLETFRQAFDALRELTWLSTAGVAPGARPVVAALRAACDRWGSGTFDWTAWEGDAERVRESVARLMRVPPASVALLSTLADAAATVAQRCARRTTRYPARPRVLVPAVEFRSNLFPWLALADHGWEPVLLEADGDGLVRTDAVVAAIDPTVRLVAITDVQSATGHRVDVAAIARRCHDVGAELFVNLTQSLGVLEYVATDVDYLAVHGYKWLLAPRGTTCLHVRPDHWADMAALAPNWKNAMDLHGPSGAEHAGSYARLYGAPFAPWPDARRLDASLAWMPWVGARAALDLLATLSPEAREVQSLTLARIFRAAASHFSYRVVPEELPTHLIALDCGTSAQATDFSQRLACQGVIASARGSRLRFGFHAFNNTADVGRALAWLAGDAPPR
jgi:selenocysteine lyase/cysteine desulfurase